MTPENLQAQAIKYAKSHTDNRVFAEHREKAYIEGFKAGKNASAKLISTMENISKNKAVDLVLKLGEY